MGQLSSLWALDLNHNALTTSLPPEMGRLSSLQYLNVNDNQLTSLPSEVAQLSSLRELYLHNNRLTSIPLEMRHLPLLKSVDLSANQLVSLPSSFFPGTTKETSFPALNYMSLVDNCLITKLPPPSSFIVKVGAQRLPVTLDGYCSSDIDVDDTADGAESELSSSATAIDFILHFYNDDRGAKEENVQPSSVHITDRHRLARRWPYFRRLLDADLSEAQSGHADLSSYFSLRLGQCLIDYFEGKPVHVSSLSTHDCIDLIEHADYFSLSTTLLLTFCIAKLKGEIRKAKRWQ
jgi:Leucine-rich repeat (LRR) protein